MYREKEELKQTLKSILKMDSNVNSNVLKKLFDEFQYMIKTLNKTSQFVKIFTGVVGFNPFRLKLLFYTFSTLVKLDVKQ